MTPCELVLSKLEGVTKTKVGHGARCPAHEDRHASLSISEGADGRVLIHCHAGCSLDSVLRAIGLTKADLFPKAGINAPSAAPSAPGLAQKKKPTDRPSRIFPSPEAAISAYNRGESAFRWDYRDAAGQIVGCICRWESADGKVIRPVSKIGTGWALTAMHEPRLLYMLPALAQLPDAAVCVTEGERCADVLNSLNYLAVTSAGGAEAAAVSDWTPLAGREVVILPDNDEAGEGYAADVARILCELASPPKSIRILRLPGLDKGGDIFDLVERRHEDGKDDDAIRAELDELIVRAEVVAIPKDPIWNPIRVSDLLASDTPRAPVIVYPLLRQSEIFTIISGAKLYKSFSLADFALHVAAGKPWLEQFKVERPGRVLLLDFELMLGDLKYRFNKIAGTRGFGSSVTSQIELLSLKGQVLDVGPLVSMLKRQIKPREFAFIAVDALYKTWPTDRLFSENDNVQVGRVFGEFERLAQELETAVVIVHHLPKGNATGRVSIEAGAGASAIGRAVDGQLLLRRHEEDGAAVASVDCRNMRSPAPFCLRFTDSLVYEPAPDLDPTKLFAEGGNRKKKADNAGESPPTPTPEAFVRDYLAMTPKADSMIKGEAANSGLSAGKVKQLLALAEGKRLAFRYGGTGRTPLSWATIAPQERGKA